MSDVYTAEGMVGFTHRARFRSALSDLGVRYTEERGFWRSRFVFDITLAQVAELARMGMPL